ncbi:MAG TPA: tRNA pseudouridine(38-40) synthase TruA [Xanthomonadales bacterium]|nr:tRNA pseudouridine(38-40) synthase TruA [Xanthomonadales bacterium]
MRIAIGIEYDGTAYLGWQRQANGPSVQATIERAVSRVADAAIELVCAGRTDTGVHARCQVAHFDTQAERSERAWVLGCNSQLPPDVCVRWAVPVADDFHARYGAYARRYRYTILNRKVRPALESRFVTWERVPLDAARMHDAAQALVGEHDFSAFRTVACQARSPLRNIAAISVAREHEHVVLEVCANAFLHHMVRNIVGTLLPIGRGEQPVGWAAALLAGRDRTVAGPTAPPTGLVFTGPLYPRAWGLPDEASGDGTRDRGPKPRAGEAENGE